MKLDNKKTFFYVELCFNYKELMNFNVIGIILLSFLIGVFTLNLT